MCKSNKSEIEKAKVKISPGKSHSPDRRAKGFGIRGEKTKDKLKICTELGEMKPLLTASKGCDGVKTENGERTSRTENSNSNGSTVCDFRNLKCEQYSALFETACEIEYISHKNLLPSKSKTEVRRSHKRSAKMGKSHSATSSPVRYGEVASLVQESRRCEEKPKSELNVTIAEIESAPERSKSGEYPNAEEDTIEPESRQSSRSSSDSAKQGEDDVWEPAEKDSDYFKSSGQTLPTPSDAKQVIETTC